MIHIGRQPGRRDMATLTGVGRRNMVRSFTRCRGAIVTRRTVAHDASVVKARRHPGRGAMAKVAAAVGRDVIGGLARSGRAVMAA